MNNDTHTEVPRVRLTMLSLYSGVGGMDFGAQMAGVEIVAHCEADPWNRQKLKRHWPEVPVFESDEHVTADALRELGIERVDIVGGGHPVSLSVLQESAPARPIRATGGHRWLGLLTSSDRLTSLSRMLLVSPTWQSSLYALTWRASVIGRYGLTFRLRPSARRTKETGSSSWATPQAHDSVGPKTPVQIEAMRARTGAGVRNLCEDVLPWSTPQARDGKGVPADGFCQSSLPRDVRNAQPAPWATPTNEDGESSGWRPNKPMEAQSLNAQITKAQPWPTPHGMADESNPRKQGPSGNELGRAVNREAQPWPTPVCTDAQSAARHTTTTGVAHSGTSLTDAIRAEPWGTPRASMTKGSGPHGSKSHAHMLERDYLEAQVEQPNQQERASLNPDWVETLVGLPIGWTRSEGESMLGVEPMPWPAARGQAQYEWEPSRVTTEKHERRKRLKALGNICVPQQVAPIFAAIVAVEQERVA